jgi:predicted SAM-dependent methyltransferase
MKVIIGAGKTKIDGWISTQENELDLLDEEKWKIRFTENSISHLLAEHVWEHLTIEEGIQAAKICFRYLKYGGLLRIAVPDGYFKNDWYQNLIQVNGPGPKDHPAASHKVVYNYETAIEVFEKAGFVVELLEYCDSKGVFHYRYWNENDGIIGRSYRFDTRNKVDNIKMVSIVLDAKKELRI